MTEHRVAPAAAKRQGRPMGAGDVLNPHRVLHSLRSLFSPELERSADSVAPAPVGSGTEPPVPSDRIGEPIAVFRTFAFVDITGFTRYCDRLGEHAAIELLTHFRSIVRDIAARRGVRVAKWLGDGVMLVGVDQGPVTATVAEIVARSATLGIDIHAGIAAGTVLLFEGDDYVGRPANLASRLCDAAEPGEVLAAGLTEAVPDWVDARGPITVEVTGVGEVAHVQSLAVVPELADRLGPGAASSDSAA